MKLFDDNVGLEQGRSDVLFTGAALRASEVHAPLAKPIDALVGGCDELQAQRQAADDAVVCANARVAWLDAALDDLVRRLSTRLLAHADGRRGDALYLRFFPEAPTEVVRLGLESEMDRVQKWQVVRDHATLPATIVEVLDDVRDLCVRGRKAIKAREDAFVDGARVSLRAQTWRADANAARRSLVTRLDDYANENNLPRDYSGRFLQSSARPAKKAAEPAPAPVPAPAPPK